VPLASGSRLGPYEILSPIGAGGMGEVYRARDSKLNRDVAIKVLPNIFASDPERLARFTREAQTLAALNHPNIAHIHGLEESGGVRALVMELVAGDDLAQRIARGPIPLDEALPIAKQIAEALEAAHEAGIIHRDLKPANIKVRPDGTVKVLDFGLAKALDPAPTSNMSQSPTITSPAATRMGVILGTAAYMSPEQAKGKAVDKRTDIWAFGCVLYEMLTGTRAFAGEDVSDTLAFIITKKPDWTALPSNTPGQIRRLLRRCLKKDPKERIPDIAVARLEIKEALTTPSGETVAANAVRPSSRWRLAAAVAFALIAGSALTGTAVWHLARRLPPADLAFTIVNAPRNLAPVGDLHATPEISPDGSTVIFYGDGVQLRRLNRLVPEPVRTGVFRNPGFWSPDSLSFVFADGTKLKKMRVPDGAPEIIANDIAALVGGSWSDHGTLLVAPVGAGAKSTLYSVPAAGGAAKEIEIPERPGRYPVWPEFLPGSEDFLFLAAREIEEFEVYLATLRDGRAADPVLLMKNATAARYTPAGGGRILFVRNDNLYAQRLNRAARRLEGEPELVQERVASSPAFGRAHFSVSRTGVLAWRPGTAGLSQVTIFDRQGREVGQAGPPAVIQTLKLAPDETRLLIGYNATAWLLEPNRPGQLQLKQGNRETLWSPDGSKFFDAIPWSGEDQRVVERRMTGEGTVRELAKPPGLGRLEDISPDGKTLLFSRGALDTAVFSARLDGVQDDTRPLVQTGETISHARFSPDGHWIVYTASGDRGGIYTGGGTYVQPYPGPGLRKQVTSRGNYPVWRKDGREIVYLDEYQGRNYVWSVPVAAPGGEFRAGTPSPLFAARLPATTFGDLNFLAVSRDGSRFYIPQAVEQRESDVIHVRIGKTMMPENLGDHR
jgi:serine/threonine protein kinase